MKRVPRRPEVGDQKGSWVSKKKDRENSRSFGFCPKELCSCRRVAQTSYLVMGAQDAGGLPADNLHEISGQRAAERFLVAVLGVVFALLHRVENCLIAAAQVGFGVNPGAMQCSR